jgi:hypothetical protein
MVLVVFNHSFSSTMTGWAAAGILVQKQHHQCVGLDRGHSLLSSLFIYLFLGHFTISGLTILFVYATLAHSCSDNKLYYIIQGVALG